MIPAFTVGYASPEQLRNEVPSPRDDYFALGALLLDIIGFTAAGFPLNRRGILQGFRMTLKDLRLPVAFADMVEGLTDPRLAHRWDLTDTISALDGMAAPRTSALLFPVSPPRKPPTDSLRQSIKITLDGIGRFLEETVDYGRVDRLWPTAPEVFGSNPLSIQYGAAGPALFMLSTGRGLPAEFGSWMGRCLGRHTCPPGLHSGLGGVAVLATQLDDVSLARRVMTDCNTADLRYTAAGLFYGEAGIGLANLHVWLATGDDEYLRQACSSADYLLESRDEVAEGVRWTRNGFTLLGLGEGQSGVALFLLLLNAVAPDDRLLETACRSLDYDLAHRQEVGTKLLWYSRPDATPNLPKSPHTWFGTAGVGTALIRCYLATKEDRYLKFAKWCAQSVEHRYTNKIGQSFGLAGFGELCLDMSRALNDERYLRTAYYLAEGLLPYRVSDGGGLAFPGDNLVRVSTDFGMGTSGVGIFLHRLLNPGTSRFLMLDDLLFGDLSPVQRNQDVAAHAESN